MSLFGEVKFSETQLPTYDDSIKHPLHTRADLEIEGKKEPAAKETAKHVTTT